jgi:hypothetical protein
MKLGTNRQQLDVKRPSTTQQNEAFQQLSVAFRRIAEPKQQLGAQIERPEDFFRGPPCNLCLSNAAP